jgi:hypothetical protein
MRVAYFVPCHFDSPRLFVRVSGDGFAGAGLLRLLHHPASTQKLRRKKKATQIAPDGLFYVGFYVVQILKAAVSC